MDRVTRGGKHAPGRCFGIARSQAFQFGKALRDGQRRQGLGRCMADVGRIIEVLNSLDQ